MFAGLNSTPAVLALCRANCESVASKGAGPADTLSVGITRLLERSYGERRRSGGSRKFFAI